MSKIDIEEEMQGIADIIRAVIAEHGTVDRQTAQLAVDDGLLKHHSVIFGPDSKIPLADREAIWANVRHDLMLALMGVISPDDFSVSVMVNTVRQKLINDRKQELS